MPVTLGPLGETMCTVAPAASSAFFGSSSSGCSNRSSTRMAIFMLSSCWVMESSSVGFALRARFPFAAGPMPGREARAHEKRPIRCSRRMGLIVVPPGPPPHGRGPARRHALRVLLVEELLVFGGSLQRAGGGFALDRRGNGVEVTGAHFA